ncbi:MAG: hypothetical protein MUF36_10310 [Bacteroidales bacterium]|nr:hypothetical protein [Bacteroidales bacterium]
MPYRRLPNTDAARIRALKTALDKGKEVPPYKLAYSAKIILRLQKFLPLFEHSIQLQRQSIASQSKKSKDYNESLRKARIYLTHFIRVMNMAIFRGDLPAETRAYYGLATNESTVPSLNTENELISWGRRIIEGEEFRIRKGGSPITNPTIAVVKVRFENFLEEDNYHKTLLKKTYDYTERTGDMRKEADEIILEIWNEIEAAYPGLPEEIRRKECEDYGIVYFYRKGELERSNIIEPQNTIENKETSLQ